MTAELTIERILESEGEVWGVIDGNGKPIVESAPSLEALQEKMKEIAGYEGITISKVIDITD